jgi:hypothetical protein
MKKHLTVEDISAFLDGEHDREAEVRKHLQQCADCAREHVALQKLSAHVQALPECEVTLGFSTRVLRAIEDSQPMPRTWRRHFWLPIGAGMAAAMVAMVGLVVLSQTEPVMDDAASPVALQEPSRSIDLAGVLGPNGLERAAFGDYSYAGGDLQVAYASEVASRPVPQEFFSGADYSESLVALNSSEKEILFQLLGSTVIDEHMM